MTWRTFVQAHWPALVAADFFTTEVWTARGLVTYYMAFVLDVQSRRVQVIGCTPHPDEAFVIQCLRQATGETGLLSDGRILLCDRDPKWSSGVEQWLATAGVRVVRTPPACAELQRLRRAVRPVGERGMPGPHRSARRTAPPRDTSRVRHALPSRAESPGTRERADRPSCRATTDWRRSSPAASRRDSQLLLPVSRVGDGPIRAWDRTASTRIKTEQVRLSLETFRDDESCYRAAWRWRCK